MTLHLSYASLFIAKSFFYFYFLNATRLVYFLFLNKRNQNIASPR